MSSVDDERRRILYASLVEQAFEFITAVDSDGTITFANPASVTLLGRTPDEMVGRNVVEFVHPDDLERALMGIATQSEWGSPLGTTSLRLLHADGSAVSVDVTAADVTDGVADMMAVYVRPADYQQASEQVLYHLLAGADARAALAPVLDVFAWQLNGSSIAISWYDAIDGFQFVSTREIPAELCGADHPAGQPWAQARRQFEGVHDTGHSMLDPGRAALARELGVGSLWIEPVTDTPTRVPALISVWAREGGRPPEGHGYGMSVAKTFVELILRWGHQLRLLDEAAHRDPLTKLANRKLFFDTLEEMEVEGRPGAVLYCDLDRFKPVNDELGHSAGDEVLREVAARLLGCVRDDDLVARLGGDEFCVLCRGATAEEADALADRIRVALDQPFAVANREVSIGISIGVAHATHGPGDETLESADRALYAAKARDRRAI